MSPINKELHKGTKPAPGVIATKPATKPVEPPTKEGLPFKYFSSSSHENIAAAAEI